MLTTAGAVCRTRLAALKAWASGGEPLRDVIYQSISPEFWGSCDAICDADSWQMHGVFNCGKGQPSQIAKMMHGAAPARFQKIRVGY